MPRWKWFARASGRVDVVPVPPSRPPAGTSADAAVRIYRAAREKYPQMADGDAVRALLREEG